MQGKITLLIANDLDDGGSTVWTGCLYVKNPIVRRYDESHGWAAVLRSSIGHQSSHHLTVVDSC